MGTSGPKTKGRKPDPAGSIKPKRPHPLIAREKQRPTVRGCSRYTTEHDPSLVHVLPHGQLKFLFGTSAHFVNERKVRFTRQVKPSCDVNVILVTETGIRTTGLPAVYRACQPQRCARSSPRRPRRLRMTRRRAAGVKSTFQLEGRS